MKRFYAMILTLAIVVGLSAAAFAEDQVRGSLPMPTVLTETDIQTRLDQAKATKNQGACLALLESILRTPDVSAEIVADAMHFAWDSDLIGVDDIISLMEIIRSRHRADLAQYYNSLLYIMLLQGRYDDAIILSREILESTPDDPDAYAGVIDSLTSAGKIDDAIDFAKEALAKFPENAMLMQYYAQSLSAAYKYAEAVEVLKDSLEIYRNLDSTADISMAYTYLYHAQASAGQFRDAARSLDHAIGGSQSKDFFIERASFRLWTLYDPNAALRDLDALIKKTPNDPDILQLQLFAYLWLDRFSDAMEIAKRLPDKKAGDRLLAIVEYYAGEDEASETSFNEYLTKYPDDGMGWLYYAMKLLYSTADIEKTTLSLKKAMNLLEDNPDAIAVQADLLQYQGLWEAAEAAYRTAWDLSVDDDTQPNNLGVFLCAMGRLDEAREVLAKAQIEYPNHYWTLCLELTVEALAEEYDAALETYDTIEREFPFMAERSLGYTHTALSAMAGKVTQAQEILDTITPITIMDSLAEAECRALIGDYVNARQVLADAKAAIPTSPQPPAIANDTKVTAAIVASEIAWLKGDLNSCINSLREACELGWFPEAAKGNWILKSLIKEDEYLALLNEFPINQGR